MKSGCYEVLRRHSIMKKLLPSVSSKHKLLSLLRYKGGVSFNTEPHALYICRSPDFMDIQNEAHAVST